MTHPYEEMKEMKKLKKHYDMLRFVCDAQYGIPTCCPCGGEIMTNVSPTPKYKSDFDTLPRSRYFTCKNYELKVLNPHHKQETHQKTSFVYFIKNIKQSSNTPSKFFTLLHFFLRFCFFAFPCAGASSSAALACASLTNSSSGPISHPIGQPSCQLSSSVSSFFSATS
ncbi:hypothetical protein F2Q68_00009415 [Brassica cretica]|uniref:Uncharacterized protein n=1 Tax=Brassica cretica TaxID=69181 RepID=A0A8S9L444_BRACR|nr:hypothetical protein F2Q68_00009415 [Brassica cretica]